MNKLIFLFIFMMSFQAEARRGVEAALITAAGVGALAGGAYSGGVMRELKAWRETGALSNHQLARSCNINYEMGLYGNNAYNYVVIGVSNQSNKRYVLAMDRVQLNFDNGARRLAISHPQGTGTLGEQGHGLLSMPFPTKEDFKGANKINVVIPVTEVSTNKNCDFTMSFSRNPDVQGDDLEESEESVTSFSVTMGLGHIISRSDELNDLADPGLAYEFSIYGYYNKNHGAFLSFSSEELENSDRATFSPLTGGATQDPSAGITNISMGYSYRTLLENSNLNYDLGISLSNVHYHRLNEDPSSKDLRGFPLYQKIGYSYRFSRIRAGQWRGDYSVGASINHNWYYDGRKVRGIRFRGHSLGGMIFFRIGG